MGDKKIKMTTHKPMELHKSDKCDKQFLFKWRLLKQQKKHDNTSLQKCHYLNNKLTCPFEEKGCMFVHDISDMCKFTETCTQNLCSFKQKKTTANISSETFKCQV